MRSAFVGGDIGADLPVQGTRNMPISAARAGVPGVGGHVGPMAYAHD